MRGLTRLELAAALGCDPRTIAKWLEEGLPVLSRGRGGRPSRYDEAKAKSWLAARNAAAAAGEHLDLAHERARKEHFQALLAEQLHKTRSGELIPRVDAVRDWGAIVAAIRTKLLAFPVAVSDQAGRAHTLQGVTGLQAALMDAICRDLLPELAGTIPARRRGRKANAA